MMRCVPNARAREELLVVVATGRDDRPAVAVKGKVITLIPAKEPIVLFAMEREQYDAAPAMEILLCLATGVRAGAEFDA